MAGGSGDGDVLRACYEAFVERRLSRGARSIRTRRGYERLRGKYQPQLRFLHEVASKTESVGDAKNENQTTGDDGAQLAVVEAKGEFHARHAEEQNDVENRRTTPTHSNDSTLEPPTPADAASSAGAETTETLEEDAVANELKQLIGVFFDTRIRRFMVETVWPLAHHGGATTTAGSAKPRPVAEWQELEEHKYFAFMFKTLLWLFPGLPAVEVQELTEWDWSKDCEFDTYGSVGLSLEGFTVSILDLALSCADSSVDKCLEFLVHLVQRLEVSLPIFRVPTTSVLPSHVEDGKPLAFSRHDQIVWRSIPLERLLPCPVRARPQFLELKVKLSVAPIVLMVLAGNERPLELQLSTSAKLLVRESDHRTSVRRNTMQTSARSHFIEVEQQFLWTFRSFPAVPTLVIIPSGLISKRTLTLYGCYRRLESHEHSMDQSHEPASDVSPILTLFTAVQEPFPLRWGAANSLCGRIDRQGSRLFAIDHRARDAKSFRIVFKTSLIQNTSSAGGSGAAAIVSALASVNSTGTARCKSEIAGGGIAPSPQTTPHSFIFVAKLTSDILATGPERRRASTRGAGKGTSKTSEASVPAQWFTSLCGANENKTIFIDTQSDTDEPLRGDDTVAGLYYVYVFTLHGFYFDVTCEDDEEGAGDVAVDSPPPTLPTPEAAASRPTSDTTQGSIVYASSDDDLAFGGQAEATGGAKSSFQGVISSAALLRQLLHRRKQRATAPPPPDFVGGAKITSVKAQTSAAGLRAKFLKARAEERRARFLQNEAEFRSKVISRLMRAESKKRSLRASSVNREPRQPLASTTGPRSNSMIPADLEAKATLMVNFFREMAECQPSQREIDENQAPVPAEQEEELLENFADLFHDDNALRNMLDEEKWMSIDEKTTRRQTLLNERVRKRRQSLVMFKKQQVPRLDSDMMGADEAHGQAKHTPPHASEDYHSTAALINQLMREVAEEENEPGESTAKGNDSEHLDQEETRRLDQLAASWAYAAAIVVNQDDDVLLEASLSPRLGEAQQYGISSELQALEDVRRDDWLSSYHVHDLANNERLQQRQATLRPFLIPAHQPFQQQEEELPWQPIWEVPTSDDGASRIGGDPQRRRSKTESCTVLSPRPPSSSLSRNRSPAVKAATLAYRHTRCIRSGQLKPTPTIANDGPPNSDDTKARQSAPYRINHVPNAFLCDPYGVAHEEKEVLEISTSDGVTESADDPSPVENDVCSGSSETPEIFLSPPAETLRQDKPRRMRRNKLAKEEKRFSGRVRELLSISPLLQSFAQTVLRGSKPPS